MMACGKCQGFAVGLDPDPMNPGTWLACLSCGWRGGENGDLDAALRRGLPQPAAKPRDRVQTPEHRAKIAAARQRFEAARRLAKLPLSNTA